MLRAALACCAVMGVYFVATSSLCLHKMLQAAGVIVQRACSEGAVHEHSSLEHSP